MAAEDFVFSVDYWFCQRQATKKRLVTAVPTRARNPYPCGARQKRPLQLPA